jgi:hypothetical protein
VVTLGVERIAHGNTAEEVSVSTVISRSITDETTIRSLKRHLTLTLLTGPTLDANL